MIRKMNKEDLDSVMQLWLQGNLFAHSFVDPHYWYTNLPIVSQQILQAEVYVYKQNQTILGFIGLVDDYIAGLFVDPQFQSQGIGKALVHYIQQHHSALTLHVFAQNERAYQFYCRQGFSVVEQNLDPQTNLLEYSMQWKTKNAVFLSCH